MLDPAITTGFFTPKRRLQNDISQLLAMIIKFWKKIWIANELRFCVLALSLVKCWDVHLSETYKKNSIFPLPYQKKKNFCPEKWASALKASCFLPKKAMDHKLVPFQRVVLTLQDATNPGPVAQFVKMQCSFKVHGACQWKWAPWCYGGSPFNNPLTKSGEGKDATKLCLGTNRRFYHPIGWPTSLLMQQRRTNRGKFAVQDNIFEQFNFKQGSDIA